MKEEVKMEKKQMKEISDMKKNRSKWVKERTMKKGNQEGKVK